MDSQDDDMEVIVFSDEFVRELKELIDDSNKHVVDTTTQTTFEKSYENTLKKHPKYIR